MVQKVKINNKGFSLVETIVAVTILTLVSIPFMDSFSRAMVVVRNTNDSQRTMFLAQSIIEGVKVHSIKDLETTFIDDDYYFDILDENFFGNNLEYTKLNYEENKYVRTSASSEHTNYNEKQYYYGLSNVSNGSKNYDALITLDSDKYNDINSRLIPMIVNVGSEGSTIIDNTGRLSKTVDDGEDDFPTLARAAIGADKDMWCIMDVYITKYDGNAFDVTNTTSKAGGYYVYAEVRYTDGITTVGPYRTGDKAFDEKNSLKYLYVVCNSKLTSADKTNNINFHFIKETTGDKNKMDIMVALVVANNGGGKWKMSAESSKLDGSAETGFSTDYRNEVQFIANDGTQNGITNMYQVPTVDPSDPPAQQDFANFGNSGAKLRRIYNLKVDIFEHQRDESIRYTGEPIVTMNSAFVR